MYEFLNELETLIQNRKNKPSPHSYVSSLFEAGLDRLLKKIGEEAGEVIIASKNQNHTELKHEAADLMFHLLLVLAYHNLSLSDITSVLKDRHHGS